MRLPRPALAALPLALLAPALARAQAPIGEAPPPTAAAPAPGQPPLPSAGTPLTVRSGRILSVDRARHVVLLEAAGGPVALGIDRNTLIYLPGGLSTLSALAAGDEVRAAWNDQGVAYWVEVSRRAG